MPTFLYLLRTFSGSLSRPGKKVSSESMNAMYGARACAMPALRAAFAPDFLGNRTRLTRGSLICCSFCAVASVEPSSTTTSSKASSSSARTLSTAWRTISPRLNVGSTILTAGAGIPASRSMMPVRASVEWLYRSMSIRSVSLRVPGGQYWVERSLRKGSVVTYICNNQPREGTSGRTVCDWF